MADIIITIGYLSIITFLVMMMVKVEVTYHNQTLILNAIRVYIECALKYEEYEWDVFPTDMEDFDRTLWRLWDWGYKRILPKEKFEIIKPYIERGNKDESIL